MTKGRVALPERVVAEQKLLFIALSGSKRPVALTVCLQNGAEM
jgi:hypothetical protein